MNPGYLVFRKAEPAFGTLALTGRNNDHARERHCEMKAILPTGLTVKVLPEVEHMVYLVAIDFPVAKGGTGPPHGTCGAIQVDGGRELT
jgi:hypothetical protein